MKNLTTEHDPSSQRLNVAAMMDSSFSNGPGDRCVIWVQGCPLRCQGCCNESFQDFDVERNLMTTRSTSDWIIDRINEGVRGLSLSGGEPLHPHHLPLLREIIKMAKEEVDFDVLAFTGYDDLNGIDLDGIDILVAGPYVSSLHHDSGLISSSNQRVIRLTEAFSDVDDDWFWESERSMEILIEDGLIHITGLVHPEKINEFLRGRRETSGS